MDPVRNEIMRVRHHWIPDPVAVRRLLRRGRRPCNRAGSGADSPKSIHRYPLCFEETKTTNFLDAEPENFSLVPKGAILNIYLTIDYCNTLL